MKAFKVVLKLLTQIFYVSYVLASYLCAFGSRAFDTWLVGFETKPEKQIDKRFCSKTSYK